jgi:predicted PurR-regulated permease PerM
LPRRPGLPEKRKPPKLLGVDYKAARATWTGALVLLGICAVYLIRRTVFVFVIALLFAYLLYPFMDLVDRRLPSKTRTPALAVTFILVIGILAAFGVMIGTTVAGEAATLAAQAPSLLDRLRQAPAPGAQVPLRNQALNWIAGQLRAHYNDIAMLAPRIAAGLISVSRNLIYVVLIPILSFFLLRDGRSILTGLIEIIEPHYETAKDTLSDVHSLLLLYMRALLLLCCVTLVTFSIVLSAMGVPDAMLLASIAFALEFIPLIGPLSAATIIIAVSIITGYAHLWWVLIFLVAFRLAQDYVLSPVLMGKGIELHPLMIILGVLAGGEIGGVAGIFLSVPVLALIRLFYHQLMKLQAARRLS